MFDTENIARQVLQNCDVSDARHAGLYSICGLALRLRDLYKWETGTPPWEEKESAEVLDWIGRKEDRWEGIGDDDYIPISVNGRSYAPFDTREINDALAPHGLFYGAGYGYSLKPTFFLAVIEDSRQINGTPVFTLGRELARDLMTLPALSQDSRVLLRTEAAGLYLWDQILYVKRSGKRALSLALDAGGISDHSHDSLRHHLDRILAICQETFIYHELGEIHDRIFDRDTWRAIIAAFPHSPVELLARSVKDLLADTGPQGTLARIVAKKNAAALGFYMAFFDGLGREIFPEARAAYERFATSGDWQLIEHARGVGYRRAKNLTQEMIAIYIEGTRKNDLEWAAAAIESRLLPHLRQRAGEA